MNKPACVGKTSDVRATPAISSMDTMTDLFHSNDNSPNESLAGVGDACQQCETLVDDRARESVSCMPQSHMDSVYPLRTSCFLRIATQIVNTTTLFDIQGGLRPACRQSMAYWSVNTSQHKQLARNFALLLT